MLDQPAYQPEGFDLRAYRSERERQLRAEPQRGHALVRLSPHALRLLQVLATVPLAASDVTVLQSHPDGWLTVRMPVESEDHALAQFLQLGSGCEILEPVTLRDRMVAELAALGQLYGTARESTTLTAPPS